ncbi:MAG: hypothetical protein N3D82_01550 [Ignisphaera sp.]|nr:hypothetical protein [Ignisphaera sp.]MCX8167703.1 hypothetical protein [Ignisphaera sp.]MDW8085267.1 hypothetical protein [Ignisphaera sp.]
MVRVDRVVTIKDETAFLAKGIKALRYSSCAKLLRVFKSPQLGTELAECMDKGPAYIVKYKNYTVVLLPDHSHVVEAKSKEEAEGVVAELVKTIM